MIDEQEPSVRLFSHADDQPREARGALIPRSLSVDEVTIEEVAPETFLVRTKEVARYISMPVISTTALVLAVFAGYNINTSLVQNEAALPNITVYDPYTTDRIALESGPNAVFSQSVFFEETRNALVEEGETFVEVNVPQEIVRYFENGVLLKSSEIITAGEKGSWWDAPSGLYKIEELSEKRFSEYTQVYLPWAISFEGNYLIHGTPEYPNGNSVTADFDGGGIRLEQKDAETLYEMVKTDMPIIVRAADETKTNAFVYEPVGPNVTAPQYLVADVENGTVLTAKGSDTVVSIASLTKLMTAVVAAEKISLDKRVFATAPTFVQSLIPRLSERSSVSMYSLLQLLLVESSNEAAEVIAGEYGRDAFIVEMNDKARLIGMLDSTFADASGLRTDNLSSTQDLFKLAQYIHKQRSFILEITETGEAVGVVGGGEFNGLTNFNVVEDDTFIGGKIGETEAAGMTSLTLHEIEIGGVNRTIAVILLGSSERDDDVASLLEFVKSQYVR